MGRMFAHHNFISFHSWFCFVLFFYFICFIELKQHNKGKYKLICHKG